MIFKRLKRGDKMATIGGKRRTRKQQKIKARRSTGRLATGKRFQQFLKNYDEAIKNGDLLPIKEIEDLRAKWSEYWNKDGTPKRSKLKSKKKREEFNADMKTFNKKYRRWGKKAVQEIADKQREKREKQAKTFGEHEVERIKKEKEKAGESTEGVDFEEIAERESKNYLAMLEMFALDTFNKLREELNVGSKVLKALAAMGLDKSTIDSYLSDFRNSYMNIPREARDLAKQDDLGNAIIDLVNLHGSDNLTDVLTEYIKADNEAEQKNVAKAGEYHANAVNNGNTKTSFAQFWKKAQGTNDIRWGDFL